MSTNKSMQFYALSIFTLIFFTNFNSFSQQPGNTNAIFSGLPWYDQNGKTVSAHGGNIVKDNGKFYLFGEAHSDTSNAFVGFNCYSSKDLYNWKFESIALPTQSTGKLGPNHIGERVKVMKNHTTGEYFMFMHVDTLGYKDQFVGYAIAKNITGPYQFKGPLLFNGKPIRKWDMGTFQDKDGSGYILVHGGAIYQLATDYKSIISETNKVMTSGFESPTLFKKENTYFFIGSNLTSWEKNDNYYYTATALGGPWTEHGLLAPKDKLTWNSQSTFVLAIEGSKDTTLMYMGDRWSYPLQLSAATYVWQPISFTDNSISIPKYHNAWTINTITGAYSIAKEPYKIIENTSEKIQYKGNWKHSKDSISASRSASTGDAFSYNFIGKQIGLQALTLPNNGYALIVLSDKKGKVLTKNTVDMYSKSPTSTLVFLSPLLPKDEYTLTVSVSGLKPNWTDKKKTKFGSTANHISLDKLIIKE